MDEEKGKTTESAQEGTSVAVSSEVQLSGKMKLLGQKNYAIVGAWSVHGVVVCRIQNCVSTHTRLLAMLVQHGELLDNQAEQICKLLGVKWPP